MLFATIYQMNWSAPTEPLVLQQDNACQVLAWQYAPNFMASVPLVQSGSGFGGVIQGAEPHMLPLASYFVIEQDVRWGDQVPDPRARHAEIAMGFELRCPLILGKKVFEGSIATPTSSGLLPEFPMTVVARPHQEPAEVHGLFEDAMQRVEGIDATQRNKFELASRWYSKASNATSAVDRFLFLWICLEIFPTDAKQTDVVAAVREFVHQRAGRGLSASDVTARLGIGRICGFRGDVVHGGKASVDYLKDRVFVEHLRRLHTIATYCLRALAGMPPGDELDKLLVGGDGAP